MHFTTYPDGTSEGSTYDNEGRAHELGHQGGLDFTTDGGDPSTYDAANSESAAHFFGPLRWSSVALEKMRHALPPAN